MRFFWSKSQNKSQDKSENQIKIWQVYQLLDNNKPLILRYFNEEEQVIRWLTPYSGIFKWQQIYVCKDKISSEKNTESLNVYKGNNNKLIKKGIPGTERGTSKLSFGSSSSKINRYSPGIQPINEYTMKIT